MNQIILCKACNLFFFFFFFYVTGTLLDQALLSLNDHLVHTKPLFLTRSYNQQWSGTHSIHTLYLNLWTFISFLSDSTFVIQHNWQVRKSNLVKYHLLSRKKQLIAYNIFHFCLEWFIILRKEKATSQTIFSHFPQIIFLVVFLHVSLSATNLLAIHQTLSFCSCALWLFTLYGSSF